MALDVRKRHDPIKPRAETADPAQPATARAENAGAPPTPAVTETSPSGSTDTGTPKPTLRTASDSRIRFGIDSGGVQRAFQLNRQMDGALPSEDKEPSARRMGRPWTLAGGAGLPAGDRRALRPVDATLDPTALGPTALGPTALGPTALGPSALDPTALGPTALGPTALGPTATSPERLSALREDAPAARVETPEEAIAILDRDFDAFDTANRGGSTDGKVSEDDLRAVADNKGDGFSEEQQQAAQVLLDSTAYRSFLDVGAGRGNVDGVVSRADLDAAKATMATGSYYDELLDTANGRGGRDGNVGAEDVTAALSDPGISQETKDALNLLLAGSDGSANLHGALQDLTTEEISDASALTRSPEYAALSGADKRLAADAFRDSGGSSAVSSQLENLITGAEFQSGSPEERTAALSRIALLNSTELQALPAVDQTLVRDTLNGAAADDLAMPGALLSLVQDPNFSRLSAAEKTSILSQSRNYPENRVVQNLDRMIDKDWFQDQSTEDKQRSTKLVAHLSQHDTNDRDITENTLERLLSPDSDYRLKWESIEADGGNITFGHASGNTLTLNRNLVGADNNVVADGDESSVIENTTAHEISHLVNGDRTNGTFEYLNEEYRAWYVGYEAENGHPPSNQEAMDRWEYFLNPDGGYSDYSHGSDSGLPFGIGDRDGALDKTDEAEQIFGLLSGLSGLEVTADNYLDVMADPSTWTTNPNDPASRDVFPAGDDLDN